MGDRGYEKGLSADWYATLPAMCILLAGLAVGSGDWGFAIFGFCFAAAGVWMLFRKLRNRDFKRKALWAGVELALLLVAVALAYASSGTWLFWVAIFAGVLVPPAVANAVAPEQSR
jgi:uncharacterized membrane protein